MPWMGNTYITNNAYNVTPASNLIGKIIGALGNTTIDQALTMTAGLGKYLVTDVVFTNVSGTPVLAAGAIYTGASKSGTAVISSLTLFTALSSALKMTRPAVTAVDGINGNALFLSLTVANVLAFTMDAYVFGMLFT